MKDGKFSIGIVGCGSRGVYFGGEDFMRLGNCYVTCVCDIRPERVEYAKKTLGPDVVGYTNVDDMLKHPDLDAVIVATSDKTHAEVAVKVLKAKKHLYLEKPMAQTIEDCDAMVDAWYGSDTVFMVGLELRYCTLMRDVKKIVERGDIGKIILGNVVDNVSVGGHYFYHTNWREKDFMKSLVLQKGTHSLDLANWIIDDTPCKVYASGGLDVFRGDAPRDKRCVDCETAENCPYSRKGMKFKMDYGVTVETANDLCVYSEGCEVSDNTIVLVDYENGARLSFTECHFTPEYSREFMFIGDKGKLTAFYNNDQDFKIMVWKRFEDEPVYYYPEKSTAGGAHGGGDAGIIKKFSELIMANKPCMIGVKGARDSAAIAIAAFDSEETGMPVAIPKGRALEGEQK